MFNLVKGRALAIFFPPNNTPLKTFKISIIEAIHSRFVSSLYSRPQLRSRFLGFLFNKYSLLFGISIFVLKRIRKMRQTRKMKALSASQGSKDNKRKRKLIDEDDITVMEPLVLESEEEVSGLGYLEMVKDLEQRESSAVFDFLLKSLRIGFKV